MQLSFYFLLLLQLICLGTGLRAWTLGEARITGAPGGLELAMFGSLTSLVCRVPSREIAGRRVGEGGCQNWWYPAGVTGSAGLKGRVLQGSRPRSQSLPTRE